MAPSRVGLLVGAFIWMFVAPALAAQVSSKDKFHTNQAPVLPSSGCGGAGCGVAFSINLKTGAETTLHNFQQSGDGYNPVGGVVEIGGTLYGPTENGGNFGAGTVFAINETTGAETVLHAFNGGGGLYPLAGLTKIGGILYGTTSLGGAGRCGEAACGNVFSIDPVSGEETGLHSFDGADGYYPAAGLIAVGKSLFGTTNAGTPADCGVDGFECVVFSLKLKNDAEKVLYTFAGGSEGSPGNGRLLDVGKLLYGTTTLGGGFSAGTVFWVDRTTGAKNVLHSFGHGSDGSEPKGGLTAVGNKLYGTTCDGGESGYGTVYSFDPANNSETVIFSFDNNDGACPATDLINVAGTLYGTTQSGAVFSINPSTGTENVVFFFNGADGSGPNPDLIYAHGNLYGTTFFGGP